MLYWRFISHPAMEPYTFKMEVSWCSGNASYGAFDHTYDLQKSHDAVEMLDIESFFLVLDVKQKRFPGAVKISNETCSSSRWQTAEISWNNEDMKRNLMFYFEILNKLYFFIWWRYCMVPCILVLNSDTDFLMQKASYGTYRC